MKYTQCGKLGELSVIGLGCWNFGAQWNKTTESDAIQIIRAAIDGGINYVDVAESYGDPDGQCELILGKALKDGYRDKVFLISKVGWYGRRETDNMTAKDGFVKRQIKRAFNKLYRYKTVDLQQRTPEIVRLSGHACCGRLQTDHIDMLLCHDGNPKDVMPFIEGFRQLKQEGFIRFYGISTDSLDTLKRFYEASNGECAACECDYSLLNRNAEDGIFKFCTEHNIVILTRGTLCRGLLSGKYNLDTVFTEQSRIMWNKDGSSRWQYEHYMSKIEELKIALNNESLTDVAYKYAFTRPEHPIVVMGCTSLSQLTKNLEIGSSYLDVGSIKIVEKVCAKLA